MAAAWCADEPVVLLASRSPPVKWPSMSPATAQSGFGVAAESSSQGTMARRGNDDGRSGDWLSGGPLPDPAPRYGSGPRTLLGIDQPAIKQPATPTLWW